MKRIIRKDEEESFKDESALMKESLDDGWVVVHLTGNTMIPRERETTHFSTRME